MIPLMRFISLWACLVMAVACTLVMFQMAGEPLSACNKGLTPDVLGVSLVMICVFGFSAITHALEEFSK
jgi:hypothetical protein